MLSVRDVANQGEIADRLSRTIANDRSNRFTREHVAVFSAPFDLNNLGVLTSSRIESLHPLQGVLLWVRIQDCGWLANEFSWSLAKHFVRSLVAVCEFAIKVRHQHSVRNTADDRVKDRTFASDFVLDLDALCDVVLNIDEVC